MSLPSCWHPQCSFWDCPGSSGLLTLGHFLHSPCPWTDHTFSLSLTQFCSHPSWHSWRTLMPVHTNSWVFASLFQTSPFLLPEPHPSSRFPSWRGWYLACRLLLVGALSSRHPTFKIQATCTGLSSPSSLFASLLSASAGCLSHLRCDSEHPWFPSLSTQSSCLRCRYSPWVLPSLAGASRFKLSSAPSLGSASQARKWSASFESLCLSAVAWSL